MRSHPFDPVSAALGLIAGAIGAVVALGGTDSIDTGWWLALGALVLGLGLVPWTRGRQAPRRGCARREVWPDCQPKGLRRALREYGAVFPGRE